MKQTPYDLIAEIRHEELNHECSDDVCCRTIWQDRLASILPSYVREVAETALEMGRRSFPNCGLNMPTVESVLESVNRKWKEQA